MYTCILKTVQLHSILYGGPIPFKTIMVLVMKPLDNIPNAVVPS